MTIDEAIRIKENDPPMPFPLDISKLDEADDLGTEALKVIRRNRQNHPNIRFSLLPGETEK